MEKEANEKHRRSVRLDGFDYRDGGWYFVTICTKDKRRLFGNIRNGMMGLSEEGCIVHECWNDIPKHFPFITVDQFVVMPNHVHGILCFEDRFLTNSRGVACYAPTSDDILIGPAAGSLGTVVRSFKSAVSKRINELHGTQGFSIWQRNYYEHIIRPGESLDAIRSYILHNPLNWRIDDPYSAHS